MRFFALSLLGVVSAFAHVSIPIAFEPNYGQMDGDIDFIARASGYTVALHPGHAEFLARGSRVSAVLLGARRARPAGEQALPGLVSYLVGLESEWRRNIPTYGRVRYRDIYPGIDLVYYGVQGALEYDFILAPGADPRQIRMDFQGARGLSLDAHGDLVIETASGPMRQRRPAVYQEIAGGRRPVAGRYVLRGSMVRFQIAAFDRKRPLVIDPALTWATFTGTAANTFLDDAQSVATDAAGNIYVAGITISVNGDDDTFILKLDPNGAVIGRVNIGGEGDDDGYGVAVDSTGAIYVAGESSSVRWPISVTYAGLGSDAFYAKIDPTMTNFVYAGFFGGNGEDVAYSCALDSANNFYIAGATNSTNLLVTRGAPQTTSGGGVDAFITKFDSTGTNIYTTYAGGSTNDLIYSVAVDAAGNLYATGQTNSTNLPVTTGAFQQAAGGGTDGFVAKYAASGGLAWLSYLGGSGDEEGDAIAVDGSGAAVVTGSTKSTNFPTASPYQATNAGGAHDLFVTRFSPDGTKLAWSTYLGGSNDDVASAIALDNAGNVYVGGTSASADFPSSNAWQSSNKGNSDGIVAALSADGSALLFSSFIGGTSGDLVRSLAVSCTAGLIVAGTTQSSNFPGTLGAAPALNYAGGAAIGFVAKVAAGTASSTISAGGIVNAATSSAAAVAPGSLVSIYGTNLAGSVGQAGSTPLPVSLNGVSVAVNGATVPLVYVSAGQINFQLPYETGTGTASATVTAGCGASAPVTFQVSSAAPYLLPGVNGDALAQNQDFSFNSSANAAAKGSVVTVYLIGIGPLDGDVATGAAAPVDRLLRARLPYKASIGGSDAAVQFLGLTPGFVGLAQANVVVPNLSAGKYAVTVTVNGVESNAANLWVK